jgi:hypothetical protein
MLDPVEGLDAAFIVSGSGPGGFFFALFGGLGHSVGSLKVLPCYCTNAQ